MNNKKDFNLENLESRTLFAGAGDDLEFGVDSDFLSGLASFLGVDDHHEQQDAQETADAVACHTEMQDESLVSDNTDVSEDADNEEKKTKKRSSRYDTSDFDWYFKKKSDSKIPEPRFSHKLMKEYKPKPLGGGASGSGIQLESFSGLSDLALNTGAAVVNGVTNLLIGSPSPDSDTPNYFRYIAGVATTMLFLKTLHYEHDGRF